MDKLKGTLMLALLFFIGIAAFKFLVVGFREFFF